MPNFETHSQASEQTCQRVWCHVQLPFWSKFYCSRPKSRFYHRVWVPCIQRCVEPEQWILSHWRIAIDTTPMKKSTHRCNIYTRCPCRKSHRTQTVSSYAQSFDGHCEVMDQFVLQLFPICAMQSGKPINRDSDRTAFAMESSVHRRITGKISFFV